MGLTALSKDFVFCPGANGQLQFLGDFEGLYRAEPDPWGQSGEPGELSDYYRYSRAQLVATLRRYHWSRPSSVFKDQLRSLKGVEIGCGHGHVLAMLSTVFSWSKWVGTDISANAIARARQLYPNLVFDQDDIAQARIRLRTFDLVIWGQMLWYVLDNWNAAARNTLDLLQPGGLWIISQAFLNAQRYGNDVVSGFPGLVTKLMRDSPYLGFRLIEARYDDTGQLPRNDGIVVLRKL